MRHLLKSWPHEFEALLVGSKTHEFRKNDRDYHVGDVLELDEWAPQGPGDEPIGYTGRRLELLVTYMGLGGTFGIPGGYVVLSVRLIGAWT